MSLLLLALAHRPRGPGSAHPFGHPLVGTPLSVWYILLRAPDLPGERRAPEEIQRHVETLQLPGEIPRDLVFGH